MALHQVDNKGFQPRDGGISTHTHRGTPGCRLCGDAIEYVMVFRLNCDAAERKGVYLLLPLLPLPPLLLPSPSSSSKLIYSVESVQHGI